MTVAQGTRRGDLIVAAALLGLALLFGGGSAASPIQRMVVELAGVVALGWFFVRGWRAPRGRSVTAALAIIAVLVLLVVVQTIPLPPGLWRTLPGRGFAANVFDVIGARGAWLPLSLDPAATRQAGFFLIPPIAMFIATLHLDREAQMKLLLLVVVAAIVSALLVMIQAQGATWLTLYDAPHATKGKGIFANKNHNAALLVSAIPLAALLGTRVKWLRDASIQRIVTGITVAVLAIAVLGCLSRAGLALLPVALLACVPLLGGWSLIRRHGKIAVLATVAILVAVALIAQSSIVHETLERFNNTQEGRYVFWPDVLDAILQFLPWGSGLGTFVPVFRINETLLAVHQTYTNHAHSDYLEIVLETGIPGLLILLAFLAWFVITGWARLRSLAHERDFPVALTAIVGILLLLAASAVDYPLRTLLLACIFAVLAAVLASPVRSAFATEASAPGEPR